MELDFQRQKLGRIGLGSILAMTWDTLRIYYRSSFWRWLYPGTITKLWLVAFVIGLVVASFGVASALTFMSLPTWTSTATYYLTLKFIPRDLRNWIFIIGGILTCAIALIKLNKIVLRAFAQSDEGDLAGIIRTNLSNGKFSVNNRDLSIDTKEDKKTQNNQEMPE